MVIFGFLQCLRDFDAQLGVARRVAKSINSRVGLTYRDFGNYAAGPRCHHKDSIVSIHAFIHAVRHKNGGELLSLPQRQRVVVYFESRHFIKCSKGLVHQ